MARVGHCPNPHIRLFRYRRVDGTRCSTILRSWQGDCYTRVMPVGHDIHYSPARGFLIAPSPNRVRRHEPRLEGELLAHA